MESVRQNVAMIMADSQTLDSRILGTAQGHDWMESRGELEHQFALFCAGSSEQRIVDPIPSLRKKVTDLFNRKYSCAVGHFKTQSIPYSLVDIYPERYLVRGLPAGVEFKRPSS